MSQIPKFGLDRLLRRGSGAHERHRGVKLAGAWTVVVLVAVAVGVAANGSERLALAVGGSLLVFGLYVADPVLLAVLVLPGSLLLQRVGGSSTNLSVADLMVFIGGVVCLFHVRWSEAVFLRQFFRGIVWYQAVLIIVVVANPNRYDIVEWCHRLSYLAASVLVGWVVATNNRTSQAIRLFLWGSSILAVVAMEHAVSTHFLPAQWGVYQKNSIGAVLWVAVLVAQLRPQWVGLGKGEARICELLCIGGLLASQSRQAAISLILAIAVATLLNPEVRRQSKFMLLGCVPLIVALYYSFSLAARNNPKFNSVSIRLGQFSDAIHVWRQSPVLGEGMHFFSLPQYVAVTTPPNVLIDNLASTGIVGSLAFFYLVFTTMRTMARLPRAVGTLGLVVLLGHYVDGLFDIFWIGASMIPPFVIAGMSLGMADAGGLDGPLPSSGQKVPAVVGRGSSGSRPGRALDHAARWARTVLAAPFRTALGTSPAPQPR